MSDKLNRRNFLRGLSGAPVAVPAAVGSVTSGLWVPKVKALSPDRYDFWTHGSSVQVEIPFHCTPPNGDLIRKAFWTEVSQKRGPFNTNWFHFAIPTPTVWDDNRLDHYDVYFRVKVDPGVVIDAVDVMDGEVNKFHSPTSITGILNPMNFHFDIDDRIVDHGLGISIHVTWFQDGKIYLISAGARFESL